MTGALERINPALYVHFFFKSLLDKCGMGLFYRSQKKVTIHYSVPFIPTILTMYLFLIDFYQIRIFSLDIDGVFVPETSSSCLTFQRSSEIGEQSLSTRSSKYQKNADTENQHDLAPISAKFSIDEKQAIFRSYDFLDLNSKYALLFNSIVSEHIER